MFLPSLVGCLSLKFKRLYSVVSRVRIGCLKVVTGDIHPLPNAIVILTVPVLPRIFISCYLCSHVVGTVPSMPNTMDMTLILTFLFASHFGLLKQYPRYERTSFCLCYRDPVFLVWSNPSGSQILTIVCSLISKSSFVLALIILVTCPVMCSMVLLGSLVFSGLLLHLLLLYFTMLDFSIHDFITFINISLNINGHHSVLLSYDDKRLRYTF